MNIATHQFLDNCGFLNSVCFHMENRKKVVLRWINHNDSTSLIDVTIKDSNL